MERVLEVNLLIVMQLSFKCRYILYTFHHKFNEFCSTLLCMLWNLLSWTLYQSLHNFPTLGGLNTQGDKGYLKVIALSAVQPLNVFWNIQCAFLVCKSLETLQGLCLLQQSQLINIGFLVMIPINIK